MSTGLRAEIDKGTQFLADGGLETAMIFHEGLELPEFASFTLLKSPEGRDALTRYFNKTHDAAVKYGTGFILDTATWRANPDWGKALGMTAQQTRDVAVEAVEFAKDLRDSWRSDQPVLINGVVGPQGDGYNPASFMTVAEAKAYHLPQIQAMAEAGVDMVSSITMCYPNEAIGIALAAKSVGIDCVISFTVETNGKLVSGYSLKKAIELVDAATDSYPVFFMINCAHPDHFRDALDTDTDWVLRIGGVRANASRMSHEELDNAEELDAGNPAELAGQYSDLTRTLPNLTLFGGCCGTDHRHIDAIGHTCTHHHGKAA